MRAITPAARTIELDVTEAPEVYFVNALDGDGLLIDILQEFTTSDEAHSFAEELARSSNLPLSICRSVNH